MARRNIHPNNEIFEYTDTNPKHALSCDSAVRAIAFAEGRPWNEVLLDMTNFGLKKGLTVCDKKLYPKYLESRGWVKQKSMRHENGTKYTIRQLIEAFKKMNIRTAIVNSGGYVTVIHEGKLRDRCYFPEDCTGNYWTFPNPLS